MTSAPIPPRYALITGASYGIGEAFARQLAAQGWRLLLTARSADRLQRLQRELQAGGSEIRIFPADLAAGGAAQIAQTAAAQGLEIELLINNAGFGAGGDFSQIPLDRQRAMLDVNLGALLELTHAFLPPMRRRGRGAIIQVGSVAGFQPAPYTAVYAASKAFVLNFSLALWRENRAHGVHVMALCPGYTDTHFFEAAGSRRPKGAWMQTPEAVVKAALRGLARRQPVVISGWPNRAVVLVTRCLPRRWVVHAAAWVFRERRELSETPKKEH